MSADDRTFDLVIFDCDGVLVDSESLAITALLDIIAEAGLELSLEEAQERFLGRSLESICAILVTDYRLSLSSSALDRMRQRLFAAFHRELEPVAGMAKTLEELSIPFCVASSSQIERIRLALNVTGLLPAFEGRIFSASMVADGKPAPDLFLYVCKSFGIAASRCLVVEDSPAGIEAANRAGMTVFGFTGGSHAQAPSHHEALSARGPALMFSDMQLLTSLISLFEREASNLVMAVDVGTGSARAGVLDARGALLGRAEHPILMNRPQLDFAEHDSEDIWQAVCIAARAALAAANVDAARIAGISFDATCSLVVRDRNGAQLSVSPSGEARWDTMVWLDHRAIAESDECTATGNKVLDFVGGVMSPEMQTPKLMWLKRNLPQTWAQIGDLFDLADFLTWKASGSAEKSQCTLTCKWTYLAPMHGGWRQDYFAQIGLQDLFERNLLPQASSAIGADLGPLTASAANQLGLTTNCRVGTGLIDAYGGTLGVIGGYGKSEYGIDRHLALIAGTSSCVMALSRAARPVKGIWGPYLGAALPEYWLNEGGQSATGALLDHVIRLHGAGGDPNPAMHQRITARIMEMRLTEGRGLASRLHVLPDFHGNRSPFADPHALGVISGLAMDSSFDSLCHLYWRTAVSIALGVRHILDALNENGYLIDTLHITGGHTKNPLLMELYADATGCSVIEPYAEDATLLGTAMVAATAAGLHPNLIDACAAMHQGGRKRQPDPSARWQFDRDYAIFLVMHRQRQTLDQMSNAT